MKTSSILKIKKALIIVFWLLLWQIVSLVYNKPLILPSLFDCINSLFGLLDNSNFYLAIFSTLAKSLLGFLAAYIIGIFISYLCFINDLLFEFINPIVQLLKATPISSVVIFVLIFSSNSYISSIISFIVVFPVVFYCCLNGYRNCNKNLVELANVFQLPNRVKFIYIWPNLIIPYLQSISDSTVSLAIKSSVASELIGLTANSIGLQFYYCKLNLQNAELICYTFIIVLAAYALEKGVKRLLNVIGGYHD